MHPAFPWAAGLSAAALILIIACSGSDSTVVAAWIEMDFGGLSIKIILSRPVNLPLDKDDATLIMTECGCPCRGDLEYERGYWQYESEDCLIRIEADTGYVYCHTTG
ncbi:MAG: hypothetical protein ABFD81_11810 [Syntrophaceae bacterium]